LPIAAIHAPAVGFVWVIVRLGKEAERCVNNDLAPRYSLRFTQHLEAVLLVEVFDKVEREHRIYLFVRKLFNDLVPTRVDEDVLVIVTHLFLYPFEIRPVSINANMYVRFLDVRLRTNSGTEVEHDVDVLYSRTHELDSLEPANVSHVQVVAYYLRS
jgi:hypothetical protein